MSVILRGWFGVRHYNDVEVNMRFSDRVAWSWLKRVLRIQGCEPGLGLSNWKQMLVMLLDRLARSVCLHRERSYVDDLLASDGAGEDPLLR